MSLKRVYKRANQGRYLSKVRIWKQGARRINVSIYKLVRKGFRTTIWYIVSDLPAAQERLAEYACRWWQECTFKDCKSNMFDWERGRVIKPERVLVLLMGFGAACWALWLLGRTHEHVPQCKATTIRPSLRGVVTSSAPGCGMATLQVASACAAGAAVATDSAAAARAARAICLRPGTWRTL